MGDRTPAYFLRMRAVAIRRKPEPGSIRRNTPRSGVPPNGGKYITRLYPRPLGGVSISTVNLILFPSTCVTRPEPATGSLIANEPIDG